MKIKFESEKALEDAICQHIESSGHCPVSGERVHGWCRQLEIPGYGITDIVKIQHHRFGSTVTVLELKNDPICAKHLSQLARYVTGIKRVLDHYRLRCDAVGQLAGPLGGTDDVFLFQESAFEVYELKIGFHEGVQFSLIDGWLRVTEEPTKLHRTIRRGIRSYRRVMAESEA